MFWSKGVGNWLTTSIISEQNHKLFRSILWSSFRNHKSVQNIMREKRPNSSAPFHFVASTLRSISRESLRNLRNYDSAVHMYTVSTVCKYVFVTDVKPLHLEQFCLLLHLLIFKQNLTVCQ